MHLFNDRLILVKEGLGRRVEAGLGVQLELGHAFQFVIRLAGFGGRLRDAILVSFSQLEDVGEVLEGLAEERVGDAEQDVGQGRVGVGAGDVLEVGVVDGIVGPVVGRVAQGVDQGGQVLHGGRTNSRVGRHHDEGLGGEDELPEGVRVFNHRQEAEKQIDGLERGQEVAVRRRQGHRLAPGLHAPRGHGRQGQLEQVPHQGQLQGVAGGRQRPGVDIFGRRLQRHLAKVEELPRDHRRGLGKEIH